MVRKSETKPKREECTYNIIEECGVVGGRGSVDVKLRYMSWNNNPPKYDLRAWKTNGDGTEKPLNGFTMSGEELESLGKLIATMMEGGDHE